MPEPILPTLILDGKKFLPANGYRATVETSIGGTSSFTVTFPANTTETYSGALMDNAIGHIGKEMAVELDGGAMQFTGLVASVDLRKGTGASGEIVLSGHGPSMLLASAPQCRSFEAGATLAQVAREALRGHGGGILDPAMGDGTEAVLPYTVQYNESDLALLQRLCRRHGLWLYHDGTRLNIGRGAGSTVKGVYGSDVTAFSLCAALAAKGPDMIARDWEGDSLLETPAGRYGASSPHPYFGAVEGGSDLVFRKTGLVDYTTGRHAFDGQRGMDRAATATAHGRAAGMVTATGSSELVSLGVGDTLDLKGQAVSATSGVRSLGAYDIIAVTHYFDNCGYYTNGFRAVTAGTVHPPQSDGMQVPFAPDQRGRVVDNADPQGMGRVQVQFEWQRPISQRTPWIKLSTPYGGAGKGLYFVPEKGEEVLVGFEGGNPEKPYVIGAGYNNNEKSGFYDADNNIKAIRTRSGNSVTMNDKDGSVTISDADGNTVVMNGAGEITISANKKLTLSSEEINIMASKTVNIEGTNKVNINSKEVVADGSSKVTVNSAAKVEVSAPSTQVEGAAELKLQSKGILDADGTTMTNIKGGLLNLN